MILCLGTTPAVQRVQRFRQLKLDGVNRAIFTSEGPAGKAVNVAKVLKLLGQEPVLVGFSGGDRGEQLLQMLLERKLRLQFLTVEARTRLCTTLLDEATGAVTELVEESLPVAPSRFDELLDQTTQLLPGCRAIIMAGTLAPGGAPDFYARCTHKARTLDVLSVVDGQGEVLRAALAARPGLVKPNQAELGATLGRKLASEAALLAGMRELQAAGAERVVITAGTGPVLAMEGDNLWRLEPPRVHALNPIGSGDAFTAALVWRLLRGDDLGEACRWGAAAGAANALTLMPGELDRVTLDQLAAQIRAERVRA